MLTSRTLRIVCVAAVMVACIGPVEAQRATFERLVPILAVDTIEPVLPFWLGLGFEAVITERSPDGALHFIAFAKDGFEVHYQTKAYIEGLIPEASTILSQGKALIYLNVDDLDALIAGLGDAEVVIPRRQTSFGADEIYVKEPGGNIIGFAQFGGN